MFQARLNSTALSPSSLAVVAVRRDRDVLIIGLPRRMQVKASMLDIQGRTLATFLDAVRDPGWHAVVPPADATACPCALDFRADGFRRVLKWSRENRPTR